MKRNLKEWSLLLRRLECRTGRLDDHGDGDNDLDNTGLILWILATVRSPFQAHEGALESTLRVHRDQQGLRD